MCRCCCCCWLAPPWQWGKPARCSVWSGWGSWSRGWRSPRRQGRPPIIILFSSIDIVIGASLKFSPLLPPRPAPPAAVRRISLQAPEKKTSFSRKGFFIFWPTIPTNPSHWYPSVLHPSKVVFFRFFWILFTLLFFCLWYVIVRNVILRRLI